MKWRCISLINGRAVERECYQPPLVWFKHYTYSAERVLELAIERWLDTVKSEAKAKAR